MTSSYDWKAAVIWPAEGYVDPETGERHGWNEQVPPDPFGYDDGTTPGGYTYQDMVGDQADAAGMEVDEFLESMLYDHGDALEGEWDDEDV